MKLYKFDILEKYSDIISHAQTSRHGGYSKSPFYSLNLAFHVHDDKESVQKNRALLADKLKYKEKKTVYMNQVHGNKIAVIRKDHDFSSVPVCDGLITNQKNIPLMVMVADCIPIMLFDPVNKVIGVVHAGRSGLFKNIINEAIQSIKDEFGSEAKNIIATLGASIHKCCYEVGTEIEQQAKQENLEFAIIKKDKKIFLDNIGIALNQLKLSGVSEKNIEHMDICTCCSPDNFYSYRKEQNTGRFAGVIFLN